MEQQYLDLLRYIIQNGEYKKDRTKTGTLSVFGYQMRFNLKDGFPLITTKKVHFKSIVHELLWFLKGETNIKYLKDNNVKIWDEWADENGDLGKIYGYQWRNWDNQIDQISNLINEINFNPDSRRLIVTAWNPSDLDDVKLPPCHCFMQFYVVNKKLSCQLYQRSADVFLGVPFNIASYSLLVHMIAQVCKLEVGEFVHTLGDVHIYKNHLKQVNLQLTREPLELPTLELNKDITNIFDFKYDDIVLNDYNSHPAIKAEVAI